MLTTMVLLAAMSCPEERPKPARKIEGVFVALQGEHDWYRTVRQPTVKEIVIANILGFDDKECINGCDKTEEAIRLIDATPKGKAHLRRAGVRRELRRLQRRPHESEKAGC